MKTLALILSVALSSAVISADIAPAYATKMDGKCCQSSDGGRSYRYRRMTMLRTQIPQTCTAYEASCVRLSPRQADRYPMCHAAQLQCLQTGTYVGPYSGRLFFDMEKI